MSNKHLFLTPRFLRAPLQNGVGRYVCQLQRLVLKFCKNQGSSRGMREFVEYDLIDFAKNHPGIVTYLKPRRHRAPAIVAEFLNGDKQIISCSNYTRDEILKWIYLLRGQQGNHDGTRLRKLWHTEFPSIQGAWTPYTFRDPSLNLVSFPNKELSTSLNQPPTATELLLEKYKKKKKETLESSRAE